MKTSKISVASSRIVCAATLAWIMAMVLVMLTVGVSQPAQAQTYKVIHNFGGQDGSHPYAGLTIDKAGNMYGTTASGGAGYGTVFRLVPKGSGWVFNPLYSFHGGNDAAYPAANLVFGPDGSLYGTGLGGGSGCGGIGCGAVFSLRPQATACKTALCAWAETVVYRFTGNDAYDPDLGELVFDQAGNIYGVTEFGGSGSPYPNGEGAVYKLSPSGGGWSESLLYSFRGGEDGEFPYSGVISDEAGNLYGTTRQGGGSGCLDKVGCGTVFQLTQSGSGWTENIIYRFQGSSDGAFPEAGVIFDSAGNLYGTTSTGGNLSCDSGFGCGAVFELAHSGNNWMFSSLYDFPNGSGPGGPVANLTRDADGNLYGTTLSDGAHGQGNIFKLSPSGNGWTYTDVYDFTGGSDGGQPISNVTIDANGNLYGTTYQGGANNLGVVWKIGP